MKCCATNRSKLIRWCIVFAIGLLTACLPSNDKLQEVTHYRIGRYDLYIPYAYVQFHWTSIGIGSPSGLIQAYYPGSAPVMDDPNALYKRDLWQKNVRILFSDLSRYPDFDPEKGLAGAVHLFKASNVVGEQYGLSHQTQPDDIKNDWDELWIERKNGHLISYISCRKEYAEGVVPYCAHHFWDNRFDYKVSYDKRLLPEWRLIRENVLALMGSFESEEAARAFIADQISKTLPTQKGENP